MGKCARWSMLFATGILAVSFAFCISFSLAGKVYADSSTSPTPAPSPTAKHTILPGISKSVLLEAEKCQTSSQDVKQNYTVLNSSGEWINTGNVSLGSENGSSYTLNEMQLSLAVDGEKADRKIEVRVDSPDGPIVGKLDLSGSATSSFTKKTIELSCSAEEGVPKQVQFYLVYKGDKGAVKINWIYVTRINAIQVTVPKVEPNIIYGDLDMDDNFTSVDFGLLRKYLLSTNFDFPIDNWLEVGDVNGDDELNAIDFALFRKRLLGLIDKFPVEMIE